jgi:carbonic anhydrase
MNENRARTYRLSRRIKMSNLDSMLERNKVFAAQPSTADGNFQKGLLNLKAIIIGCADMRVDPAHVLGIKLGEAVVMRNIGGRITPGLLEQLAMLGRIGEVAGEVPGGGGEFHIIVLQHTDCGMTRLAGETAMLIDYFQVPAGELKSKTVLDPRAAVAGDVATLRAVPALPGNWLISGLVYDVASRRAEVVVAPAPIRSSTNPSQQGSSAA